MIKEILFPVTFIAHCPEGDVSTDATLDLVSGNIRNIQTEERYDTGHYSPHDRITIDVVFNGCEKALDAIDSDGGDSDVDYVVEDLNELHLFISEAAKAPHGQNQGKVALWRLHEADKSSTHKTAHPTT